MIQCRTCLSDFHSCSYLVCMHCLLWTTYSHQNLPHITLYVMHNDSRVTDWRGVCLCVTTVSPAEVIEMPSGGPREPCSRSLLGKDILGIVLNYIS